MCRTDGGMMKVTKGAYVATKGVKKNEFYVLLRKTKSSLSDAFENVKLDKTSLLRDTGEH